VVNRESISLVNLANIGMLLISFSFGYSVQFFDYFSRWIRRRSIKKSISSISPNDEDYEDNDRNKDER
jgi:hypothetical protein